MDSSILDNTDLSRTPLFVEHKCGLLTDVVSYNKSVLYPMWTVVDRSLAPKILQPVRSFLPSPSFLLWHRIVSGDVCRSSVRWALSLSLSLSLSLFNDLGRLARRLSMGQNKNEIPRVAFEGRRSLRLWSRETNNARKGSCLMNSYTLCRHIFPDELTSNAIPEVYYTRQISIPTPLELKWGNINELHTSWLNLQFCAII